METKLQGLRLLCKDCEQPYEILGAHIIINYQSVPTHHYETKYKHVPPPIANKYWEVLMQCTGCMAVEIGQIDI